MWECVCDCGNKSIANGGNLKRGTSRSCGCFAGELWLKSRTTHGRSKSREHKAWCRMKVRCYSRAFIEYHRYGGRGISVCDRWLHSFENFFEDMGLCPPDMSLDRINNNGNYEPGNCRWATTVQQLNNTSRSRHIEHAGRKLTLSEWSKEIGIGVSTLWARINSGWDASRALTEPLRNQHV